MKSSLTTESNILVINTANTACNAVRIPTITNTAWLL